MVALELFGDRDLSRRLAFVIRHQLAIAPDHVAHREQAAIRRHKLEELRGEPTDAGFIENGSERLQLLLGGKYRASHQAVEIGTFGNERIETVEVALYGVDGIAVTRQIE